MEGTHLHTASLHGSAHSSILNRNRNFSWFRAREGKWDVHNHNSSTPSGTAEFSSRQARKARFTPKPHIPHTSSSAPSTSPDKASALQHVLIRVKAPESYFKPNLRMDISFWVAWLFWWGSAVWVCNGFCIVLPLFLPDKYSSPAIPVAASALAFVGGTLFEIGAYAGVLEAENRGREGDFGLALEYALFGTHPGAVKSEDEKERIISNARENIKDEEKRNKWMWFGPARWHDLGYLAAIVQMAAATIFWVSTITGLPGVIPGFSEDTGSLAIIDIFFWLPQVVGGTGFVISSLLIMIEVQPGMKWYKIQPFDIGWQVGLWNLIGAIGFLGCGALGFSSDSKAIYQSDLFTFWGSWSFLIGSTFQVYEVVMREPEENKDVKQSKET